MKLRNKKTGEIMDLECVTIFDRPDRDNTGDAIDEFYSLADLNTEWEDYEPKEPLIKDEEARDAIGLWASTLHIIHRVGCTKATRGCGREVTTFEASDFNSAPRIEFASLDADVADGNFYTIAELCGEEEE